MGYKSAQFDVFNPREELLPYAILFDKAAKEERERQDKEFEWLSSSSELLKHDEDYLLTRERYNNNLLAAADSLSRGDLKTARSYDLRADSLHLKLGQRKAEILSELIREQAKNSDKYAYDVVYTPNTPLRTINETSTYNQQSLDKYRGIGLALGKSINALASPLEKGNIIRGSKILLQQGYSHSQILDMLADSNSDLRSQVDLIRDSSGISDPSLKEKIDLAIIEGILNGVGTTTTMVRNPNGFESPGERMAYNILSNAYAKQVAMDRYNQTGDLNELRKSGTRVTEYGRDEKTGKPTGVVIANYDYPIIGWRDNGTPILGKPKTVESSNKSGGTTTVDNVKSLKTAVGGSSNTPVNTEGMHGLMYASDLKINSSNQVTKLSIAYIDPNTGETRLLNLDPDINTLGAIVYLIRKGSTSPLLQYESFIKTRYASSVASDDWKKVEKNPEYYFDLWYQKMISSAPKNNNNGQLGTGGNQGNQQPQSPQEETDPVLRALTQQADTTGTTGNRQPGSS